MEEFLEKVIDNCISSGHNTTEKIIEKIKSEIYDIEKKMLELNSLKDVKNNYNKLLKFFSDNNISIAKSIDKNFIYSNMLIDNQLSSSIIEIIHNSTEALTGREIFVKLGLNENKYNIYSKIIQKMLVDKVLIRDKYDKIICT